MQIGVIFPQTEFGTDPIALRDYAQAVQELGYKHIAIYDHVLGADPTKRPGWQGYTTTHQFHEPFVLFGYFAALTHLELVTSVLILPQRQTALVAKQAAEVDILTGGRFRLGVGVGWNAVEYEALGKDFHTRGKAVEEQIEVLRLLWSREVVSFQGTFHTIAEAGLNPLPVRRTIPIWLGGTAEIALKRVARLGDGWFPQRPPDEQMKATLERLYGYIHEAGRDPSDVGIEARLSASTNGPEEWARVTEDWKDLGATHISFNTMGSGYDSPKKHIEALRRYREVARE